MHDEMADALACGREGLTAEELERRALEAAPDDA
jgi:hypothetical protein